MTEQEAKEKWCPMARVIPTRNEGGIEISNNSASFNRGVNPNTGSMAIAGAICIGSQCAWWVHERTSWCHADGREPTKDELHQYKTPEEAGLITVKFGHCGAIR